MLNELDHDWLDDGFFDDSFSLGSQLAFIVRKVTFTIRFIIQDTFFAELEHILWAQFKALT